MAWQIMSQEEVKSVEIGQKIKVNGVETVVSHVFPGESDYGFVTVRWHEHTGQKGKSYTPVVPDSSVTSHFDQNTFEKYQE